MRSSGQRNRKAIRQIKANSTSSFRISSWVCLFVSRHSPIRTNRKKWVLSCEWMAVSMGSMPPVSSHTVVQTAFSCSLSEDCRRYRSPAIALTVLSVTVFFSASAFRNVLRRDRSVYPPSSKGLKSLSFMMAHAVEARDGSGFAHHPNGIS